MSWLEYRLVISDTFTLSVQSLRQVYLREAAERELDFFLLSYKTYKPKAIEHVIDKR